MAVLFLYICSCIEEFERQRLMKDTHHEESRKNGFDLSV